MSLVSFERAMNRLGLPILPTPSTTKTEVIVREIIEEAEAIIIDYLKKTDEMNTSPPLWDQDTVPAVIRAAILQEIAELWRFRGDHPEGQGPATTDGDLSPVITNMLRRYRDPAYA